jgi:glutathione S-transferase
MTQLTLTYFDFHGGRGEPARLALSIGGIAFEDKRFGFADFPEIRKATPLNQVPTLHVDGVQVSQSDAITRYAGKLSNLYPTDAFQALLCDEVLQGVEDLNTKLGTSFGLTGDALQEARSAFVAGPLTTYLRWLDALLTARGGEYFADQRLTVADLKVFVFVRGIVSGRLDHVPTDIVEKLAPGVHAHMLRVAAHPGVSAYYAKFAK